MIIEIEVCFMHIIYHNADSKCIGFYQSDEHIGKNVLLKQKSDPLKRSE